jgi:hypothetical protein
MIYLDGSVFTGIFKEGHPCDGTFEYVDNKVYKGKLEKSKPHGLGIFK